ncbi:hypothetical protein HK096_002161, partial [Nowakowskiella sp. JEL0078]
MLLPSIGTPLIDLDFRSPSPMFSLDDYDDSDHLLSDFLERFTDADDALSDSTSVSSRANSSVTGIRRAARMGFGRYGVGDELLARVSAWNSSAIVKPVAAIMTTATTSGSGEVEVHGPVMSALTQKGGATITRSLSDGDLSDYLKGFSELRNSVRVAKS